MALTEENIGFLVVSVLLWFVSVALIVLETVYTVIGWREILIELKFFSIALHRHQKIAYILLLTVGYVLLLVVLILWITFAATVGNPNS